MNIAHEQNGAAHLAIRERLETTNGVVFQVRDSVAGQAAALYKATILLEQLYKLVSGDIRASWRRLEDIVAGAWYVACRIHTLPFV